MWYTESISHKTANKTKAYAEQGDHIPCSAFRGKEKKEEDTWPDC